MTSIQSQIKEFYMSEIREECGVFGIYSDKTGGVAASTYYGLFALQHRGQESCGIVVCDDGVFRSHVDSGIVNDVFTTRVLESLGEGSIAVGHVRYGMAGASGKENNQPMVINHVKGRIAIANNGNLTNYRKLKEELELGGAIFHSVSDCEVISYILTRERLKCGSIEEALNHAMNSLEGAYSLVIMSPTKLLAVRDVNGFKPLCVGKTDDGAFVVASESCALDAVGAHFIRDVEPGEIIVADKSGVRSIRDHCKEKTASPCVFEYIYFARPDSVIDKMSVHAARIQAGRYLAKEHPVDADVVVGVPDSGIDAALGYSYESGITYGLGFIKNKYIGRTFIVPGQSVREDKVRIKLNPVSETVKGKRVVLVDDSIVRGTTSARIVKLLRNAGAKEVHLRITAPPFTHPCYYGTDINSTKDLIACNHTLEEITKILDVDSLGYLSIESVKKIAVPEGGTDMVYCTACFDGEYPTDIPEVAGKHTKYDRKISEGKE